MRKIKWALILLGVIDLILVIMYYTDYYFLFLKPTGYVIPFIINLVVVVPIAFRLSRFVKLCIIIVLFISIPAVFNHSFVTWLLDYSYTTIDSPHNQQSLVIEHRHATLGETTYFYNFYRTTLGLVGKRLDDQSITMMIQRRDHPLSRSDAEGALGLGKEEWITENAVRFSTWQGMKDVYLSSSQSFSDNKNIEELIEEFIKLSKQKENGEAIMINGNMLTLRYDEASDQRWIEITNKNNKGSIPTQQCSHIKQDEERGYYMLEECTHQWEYPLYPLKERS